jgi:hypothetical protein
MLPISAALGFRDGFLYRLWKRSAGFERSRQSRLGKTERKAKKSFFFFQERVRCKPGTPAGGEGRGDVVGVAYVSSMGPRIQRWDPESGQLGPARKDFLGPRRCLEIERSLNPAFHYRDNKKGGGGALSKPRAAPAARRAPRPMPQWVGSRHP